MSNRNRPPNKYLTPNEENLPPNSILKHVKVGDTVKPPSHLMRIFGSYVEKEVINPQNLPWIDYYVFGKRWLALFNYGAHEDHTQIPLMDWVSEVAGSPYKEVRLIKDGEEVGRIPALFDRLVPVMKDDERDYFANIAAVQSVIHRGGNQVREADGFIERNITNRIEVRQALTASFHRMSAIFNLYGVERVIPKWIQDLDNYTGVKTQIADKAVAETTAVTSGMIEED